MARKYRRNEAIRKLRQKVVDIFFELCNLIIESNIDSFEIEFEE